MANPLFLTVVTLVIVQCATASNQDQSRIVISPEDTLIYQGQTLLTPCVAYIDDNTTATPLITWMKNGSPLSPDSRHTVYEAVDIVVSGVRFVRVMLEVCGVRVEDTGRYSCVLTMNGVESDRTGFEMTVTQYDVPTQILVSPQDLKVSQNDSVQFSCVAHALPPPNITWSQNSLTLEPRMDTDIKIEKEEFVRGGVRLVRSTLEMCNVRQMAGGTYQCVANNGITSNSASFEMIRDAPIQLLSGPTTPHIATAGTPHSFTCDFHSFPHSNITWEGVPLISGGRFEVHETLVHKEGVKFVRSVLRVNPVAEYDGGMMACVASNGVDQLRHSFQFQVFVPPEVVIHPPSTRLPISSPGHSLTLTCVAHAASLVHWRREGQEMNSDPRVSVTTDVVWRSGRSFVRSVMEVCDVEAADSGEYSCEAVKDGHSDLATFDICVIETTGLLITPPDITMGTGHSLSATCVGYTTLTSAHFTELQWTRDNHPLSNTSRVTLFETRERSGNLLLIKAFLLVNCPEPEDTARYGCHVTSDKFKRSSEFNIHVQSTPQLKPPENPLRSINPGDTITLTCVAGGHPLPTITWLKDHTPLYPELDQRLEIRQTTTTGFDSFPEAVESMLTIRGALETDSGSYICLANSTTGFVELATPYELQLISVSIGGISGGISHGSYVGSIVGSLCFLALLIVYILVKSLRVELSTPTLINMCISLIALNFSYIISFNATQAGNGCTLFAALFHYFFLAACLSVTNFIVFKVVTTETKRMAAYVIAFSLNWGIPLLVVVVSLAPDVSNYQTLNTSNFCGPRVWPYWFGEILPFALLHLLTWITLVIISLTRKFRGQSSTSRWVWDTMSTGVFLLLFDITWGVGLPSTQETSTVLHVLFLIFSILFGLMVFIIYCLVYRKARIEVLKVFNQCITSKLARKTHADSVVDQSRSMQKQQGYELEDDVFQDRGFSMSGFQAAKLASQQLSQEVSQPFEPIAISMSESITKEDLGQIETENNSGSVSEKLTSVTETALDEMLLSESTKTSFTASTCMIVTDKPLEAERVCINDPTTDYHDKVSPTQAPPSIEISEGNVYSFVDMKFEISDSGLEEPLSSDLPTKEEMHMSTKKHVYASSLSQTPSVVIEDMSQFNDNTQFSCTAFKKSESLTIDEIMPTYLGGATSLDDDVFLSQTTTISENRCHPLPQRRAMILPGSDSGLPEDYRYQSRNRYSPRRAGRSTGSVTSPRQVSILPRFSLV